MSRYGTFTWGDGTLWGSVKSGSTLVWSVEVDWNNDGVFDGTNESPYVTGLQVFRGKRSFLKAGGSGFTSVETGSVRISLKNRNGRYDPWNTSSPLYPNVMDGRDVRVKVLDLATGTLYPVFYGIISDIQTSGKAYDGSQIVTLIVEDGWRKLRRAAGRVAIMENTTPDAAIGAVLDAAKWPARWGRLLDSSVDSIPYFWSSGNILAGTEIERVAQSFVGYFFISRDGQARFINRSNAASASADFPQDKLLKDIYVSQPWENRRNITRIKVHPLTTAATVTIWQYAGTPPTLSLSTPLTLWASYTYNNGQISAKNVITPVAFTDYTANLAADGSGIDQTANVTATMYNFGDTAKIILTTTQSSPVYMTALKIRGDAVYETGAVEVTYPTDTTTELDPREFVLDLPWQQNVNQAADFAAAIGPFIGTSHPFLRIQVENRPDLQFTPELFDIVTATISRLGISGVAFRLAGIEHQTIGENCQHVLSSFYLEPYISSGTAWTWPITNFGVDTVFAW